VYDLHAIAGRLTHQEMREVEALAVARGLGRMVCDGLALAREWFGTPSATVLIDALRSAKLQPTSAAVVEGRWGQADVVRLDLMALRTWRERGRLIREHLLPAPAYMRGKYGVRSNVLLPALYAWRVIAAAPRWLRRREGSERP